LHFHKPHKRIHLFSYYEYGSNLFNNAWFWYWNVDLIFLKILIYYTYFFNLKWISYEMGFFPFFLGSFPSVLFRILNNLCTPTN
jgi:hypothetical protein